MKTTYLTNAELDKLHYFFPGKGVVNVEGDLFLTGSRINLWKKRQLLKRFTLRDKQYLDSKLLNITTLINYSDTLGQIEELVLPDSILVIGGKVVGCTMPFIEKSANLQTVLENKETPLEERLTYLKQIALVLEKIENLSDFPYEFHIGDLHEGNCILKDGKIKIIDLDSAYISNNTPFQSKYLVINKNLEMCPHKYKVGENGLVIPTTDTDRYCLIIMLLNTLSRFKICDLSINEFYEYLNYLEDIGLNKELLAKIENIYHEGETKSILEYFDELIENAPFQAHHLVYKAKTGKDLKKY